VSSGTKQQAKFDEALQEAFSYRDTGRLAEAEQVYRSILKRRPSHSEANTGLGHTLKAQGKFLEAEGLYRRVVAVAPNSPDAHNDLGVVLLDQDKLEEAEAAFRKALALDPEMTHALRNLGLIVAARGRLSESLPLFKRHAALAYGKPNATSEPTHKIQHDQEQRQYLDSLKPDANTALDIEGERVTGNAVNTSSRDQIASQWQTNSPQYVVVDNFLNDEALARIRHYCWGAPIWKFANSAGFIRALPEHGFACPLLVQIEEEMRSTFPTILKQHELRYWWAYKYETERKGTHVHADFAAINVNYWPAPDEANLDPNTGGLIIWDKPAPLDWGYAKYNASPESAAEFLKRSGARPVTVPHRGNRAVIFNSNLFHETDKISFKPGYQNRRINITMLYGLREKAGT
jgi:Tfp pilus assembly protein PilF